MDNFSQRLLAVGKDIEATILCTKLWKFVVKSTIKILFEKRYQNATSQKMFRLKRKSTMEIALEKTVILRQLQVLFSGQKNDGASIREVSRSF